MHRLLKFFAALLLLSLSGGWAFSEETSLYPPAPDFPKGLEWLNVSRPLSLADLRGKVVILDFWTYGCINCIHVMEELKGLKRKYGDRLVVVGVHTPKFENEQDLDQLRSVMLRYSREDPVVNDPGYVMMKSYRAPAWPTLVVIDPLGNFVGRVVGEGHQDRLDRAIGELLKIHGDAIDDRPLALITPESAPVTGWFGAPEKIAASSDRVAVSDSRLHRILVAGRDAALLTLVGGTEAGFEDGRLDEARFRSPHGLVFDSDGVLYVADTGNHALRRIDLDSGRVTTIAGTGRKSRHLSRPADLNPLNTDLRSPWDLALTGANLYIAMAGDHRIWLMDLERGELGPFAGSGREGIDDGPAAVATFSQPSGLALVGDTLFVADAEASAIREINLLTGTVSTLAGTGLHDFGDRSGPLQEALLQHPQGVVPWTRDRLLVADTYNHKLKLLDLEKQTIDTLLGPGVIPAGDRASLVLDEPGGLAVQGERVLIADTNNRRILVFSPDTGTAEVWQPRDSSPEPGAVAR